VHIIYHQSNSNVVFDRVELMVVVIRSG